jgi:hypothetical protein
MEKNVIDSETVDVPPAKIMGGCGSNQRSTIERSCMPILESPGDGSGSLLRIIHINNYLRGIVNNRIRHYYRTLDSTGQLIGLGWNASRRNVLTGIKLKQDLID